MSGDDSRRRALFAMAAAPVGLAACATSAGAAGEGSDLAARLDRIEGMFAINEVLQRYARACDRADEPMMRDCFWPESKHKHGRFDGTSSDFVGFSFGIISTLKFAAHHVSNVSVEVGGDRGFSECHYLAHHRRNVKDSANEEDAFFEGRYIDLHERRNGVWKIIRRRGLSDHSSVIPANKPFAEWPADQRSGKSPDDDYYAMREMFRSGSR